MIARGDLGIEVPIERIPGIQRTIIRKYRIILIFAGKTDFFDVLSEEMAGDLSYQEMYTEAQACNRGNPDASYNDK